MPGEKHVTFSLRESIYERVKKSFPFVDSEPDGFERAILAMLGPVVAHEGSSVISAKLANRTETGVGIELHGGPEGHYFKEQSTGRWRSVSRARSTRDEDGTSGTNSLKACPSAVVRNQLPARATSRERWEEEVDRLEEQLMAEFEVTERSTASPQDGSENCVELETEVGAARAAARCKRAEVEKLWEAAKATIKDPTVLVGLSKRDALSQALAEGEFEKQRLANAWELIRANIDMKTFATLTRRATGCEGERALSVGAARRLFDSSPTLEKPCVREGSREPLQSRALRLGRGARREPDDMAPASKQETAAPQLETAKFPTDKLPQRPNFPRTASRPNVALPPRRKAQSGAECSAGLGGA